MSAPGTTRPSRFLDLPALSRLAHLRFATRHRVEGAYSGRHQSRLRGGAGEFADFRAYVEGEDLRRLDWRVLARTGRAYVRLYQDETNLRCTLVIDASESMRFDGIGRRDGTGSKLTYVQYLATALSYLISRQQDQVGLATVANGLRQVIPPGSTGDHVRHVQAAIEQVRTEPVTRLAAALRDLFPQLTHRGALLILSDFLDPDFDSLLAALRRFRHEFWEVVLLHVVHPDEERLPEGPAYRFEGLEGEGQVSCSPAEIQARYQARFEAHAARLRDSTLAMGCDYRRVSTALPYLQTLSGFLVERAG